MEIKACCEVMLGLLGESESINIIGRASPKLVVYFRKESFARLHPQIIRRLGKRWRMRFFTFRRQRGLLIKHCPNCGAKIMIGVAK